MTRAAIYTRVSSEEQAAKDKASLPYQRKRCEAYCAAQDWEVAAVYEDAGVAHIELTNYDFTGLFEGRGYSDDADIPSDTSGPQ